MNKYLLIVLITLLYYSCEDSSNIISFDEIKNELTENKRKKGFWIEFKTVSGKFSNNNDNSKYFRVVNYDNGFPKGTIREYFLKDSLLSKKYNAKTLNPNTAYVYNPEIYTDTVYTYDNYGTILEKEFYFNDSLGTKFQSTYDPKKNSQKKLLLLTKMSSEFKNRVTKLNSLSKYISSNNLKKWKSIGGKSKISASESLLTLNDFNGFEQSLSYKILILDSIIQSAEISKKKRIAQGSWSFRNKKELYGPLNYTSGYPAAYKIKITKNSHLRGVNYSINFVDIISEGSIGDSDFDVQIESSKGLKKFKSGSSQKLILGTQGGIQFQQRKWQSGKYTRFGNFKKTPSSWKVVNYRNANDDIINGFKKGNKAYLFIKGTTYVLNLKGFSQALKKIK
jgi:hypothetical protein